jgi:uncharacterized protein with PQ loop repeat
MMRSIAVIGPLTGLPQVMNIWIYGNTNGVSILSWTLFMIISCLWLTHAVRRKDRALALSNLLWIVIDAVIILGSLVGG